MHCTHQLYSTFNAICRLYGQCLEATEEIRGEWELFRAPRPVVGRLGKCF